MKKYLFSLAAILFSVVIFAQNRDTVSEKSVSIKLKGVTIEGSLLSVHKNQKLVIIVAGSGATDRNGNSKSMLNGDSYKLLAGALAKNNIASFRYDKRAIGKSLAKNFKESDLTFENYINDAIDIYNFMKDSLGFSEIFFAGHSEGALICNIASKKVNPAGYISIAGAGRPLDKLIVEQLSKQNKKIGQQTDSLFAILKTKSKIDSVPPYLMSIFRPSLQPYMLSSIQFDPATEIKKIKCPILLLQGSCDAQVLVLDAQNLYNANTKATLKIIDKMTHVLKDADENCKDPNFKTYTDPKLPLNEELVKDIVEFVKKN